MQYPFAFINYYPIDGDYVFAAFESQNYFTSYGKYRFGTKDDSPKVIMYTAFEADGQWTEIDQDHWTVIVEKDCPPESRDHMPVIWANFDLKYSDGTIYCAASNPVPSYG